MFLLSRTNFKSLGFRVILALPSYACSKLTIETTEQCVKSACSKLTMEATEQCVKPAQS